MITFFTIPKPFAGHIAAIQRNAILSWKYLPIPSEVILLGEEKGVAETAGELGVRHLPQVARNEFGTPLLDSAFRLAQEAAAYPIMIYANADIIFLSDLPTAVRRIPFKRYLIVGRRTNLDLDHALDIPCNNWEKRLREYAQEKGKLFDPTGIDYFIFPRHQLRDVPPFAVGRVCWDNWMIYHARQRRIPVIDATAAILAIHQNHDYGHIQNGKEAVWNGPEARRNLELAGGWDHIFFITDATWKLNREFLFPALSVENVKRRWKTKWALHPKIFRFLVKLWGLRRFPAQLLSGKKAGKDH